MQANPAKFHFMFMKKDKNKVVFPEFLDVYELQMLINTGFKLLGMTV